MGRKPGLRELFKFIRAFYHARHVQEFLWGDKNQVWNFEEWRRMLRKRVQKLEGIENSHAYPEIEIKKRLLQTAAVSIAMLVYMDRNGMPPVNGHIRSNLDGYAVAVTETRDEANDGD